MSNIIFQTGVAIVLYILAVGFSGCSESQLSVKDSTVQVYAVVGSRMITEVDLEREYARRELLGWPNLQKRKSSRN